MAMAVILGKNIYNIGELMQKDVMKALIGTDYDWLYQIMRCLDGGHILDFNKVIAENQEVISKHANILKEMNHLQMKVRILALIELVF